MSSLPRTVSKNSHSNNGWKQDHIGRDASFQYRPINPSIVKKMPTETVTFVDIKLLQLLSIRLRGVVEHFRIPINRE